MLTRVWTLPLLIALALAAGASSALAAEEDFLYDPGTVNVIEIQLAPAQIEELEEEPREYVENGEVVLKSSDGTPTGVGAPSQAFKGVEVKLKGQPAGSFENLGGKAAFKLKFKKKELFFGVRKLTLNNMTQDPSMVHEALAYTAFGAAGVPASRSGYAFVYLNGTSYGLHANVESLDTYSLPRIFGAPFDEETQHLYEAAEYGADFYPGKEAMFEIDEGDEDSSDLTNAIAAVDADGSTGLTSRLALFFDFTGLTRMWAVEKYIGHWDGYAGSGIPGDEGFNLSSPNNYYLYSEASGRFSMLPWGTDQTWGDKPGSGGPIEFDEQDGRLFDFCLEDSICGGMFRAAVADAAVQVGGLDLDAQATATAAMLEPWQELEEAPHDAPYSSAETAAAVDQAREFVVSRPAEAAAWLAEHPIPWVPTGSGVVVPPLLPVAPTVVSPRPEAAEAPTLTALGARKGGSAVRLRVRVATAGNLALQGRSSLEGRRRGVCHDEIRADRGGVFTLVCRLSARALRRLDNHSLPVALRTTFAPDVGAAGLHARQLTLPRH
jgi:hypothetical protein